MKTLSEKLESIIAVIDSAIFHIEWNKEETDKALSDAGVDLDDVPAYDETALDELKHLKQQLELEMWEESMKELAAPLTIKP